MVHKAIESIKPFLIKTINIIMPRIRSIRQFLNGVFLILKLPIDYVLIKSNKCHFMDIKIPENSRHLLRDIIMLWNDQRTGISSETLEKIEVQFIVSKQSMDQELDKVFTFCCLHQFIGNVHFKFGDNCFKPWDYTGCSKVSEKDEVQPVGICDSKIDLMANLNTVKLLPNRSLIELPFSKSAWAWNTLKNFDPSCIFCCISLGSWTWNGCEEDFAEWRDFFVLAHDEFPKIRFVILDAICSWFDSLRDMPNIVNCNILGYSFLDKIAILDASDMFVGAYDEYAATIVGTSKPGLFYCNDLKEISPSNIQVNGVKPLTREYQVFRIAAKLEPEAMLSDFREFYKKHFESSSIQVSS